jgi:hypothetical protein
MKDRNFGSVRRCVYNLLEGAYRFEFSCNLSSRAPRGSHWLTREVHGCTKHWQWTKYIAPCLMRPFCYYLASLKPRFDRTRMPKPFYVSLLPLPSAVFTYIRSLWHIVRSVFRVVLTSKSRRYSSSSELFPLHIHVVTRFSNKIFYQSGH